MNSIEVSPDHGWFSVRCLFRLGGGTPIGYEERITLWRAESFEEAIVLAETEADEYARAVDGRYLELAQAYHLDDVPGHGAEVYSMIRDSTLAPDQYLTAFFDTGAERQGWVGETPETVRQIGVTPP